MSLSKSSFVKGVQCPKMLWLAEYAADERTESDNSLIFENGHRVGELAKEYFGEYVEVTFCRDKKPEMIAETERFLEEGCVNICEASFGYDGLFCMVDILHRNEDGSFDMIEVKSATKLKEVFEYDIAFQYYVLTHSGIDIRNAYCMYINKEYERQGDISREDFFVLEDCTGSAKEMQQEVEEHLSVIKAIMASDTEPAIAPGSQCDEPYECEFKRHCGAPECGFRDIREAVPADEEAARSFSERISYPLCCLWIDLCGWPIPPFNGMRPYKQTPFHYALSVQNSEGEQAECHGFFPDVMTGGETDPRRSLAEALCSSIPDGAVIVTCRRGTEAYDKNVEARLIKNLAYTYTDLKEQLQDISSRCIDVAEAYGAGCCLRPSPAEGMQELELSYLYLHEKTEEEIQRIREIIQEQGKANIMSIADAVDRISEHCLTDQGGGTREMCLHAGDENEMRNGFEARDPETVWRLWKEYANRSGRNKKGEVQNYSIHRQLKEIEKDGFPDLLLALLGDEEKKESIWEDCAGPDINDELYERYKSEHGLNPSQQEAAEKALSYPVSFIQGPPGTGKTWTIIDIMARIAAAGKKAAVISTNGAAIDTIEEKIKDENSELYAKTARLGNKKIRKNFTAERDDRFNFRAESGVSSEVFLEEYPLVLSTIHSLRTLFSDSKGLKYDYVIIDETSQAAVALGFLAASCARHLVLVGDEEQLPAVYDESAAGMVNDADAEAWRVPGGRKSFYCYAWNALKGNDGNNRADAFLSEHYRCHPGIIRFCNDNVYDERMTIRTPEGRFQATGDVKCPIRVIYYDGEYDERTSAKKSGKGSKHNMRQIEILRRIIGVEDDPLYDGIDGTGGTGSRNTAFLSPFRGQQEEVKTLLKKIAEDKAKTESLYNDTGKTEKDLLLPLTVHKAQGKEWNRVFFLPVEDGDWEWPWSQKKNLINVMVSRSVEELIIITSTRLMSRKLQLELTGQYIPPRKSNGRTGRGNEEEEKDERFLQLLLDYVRETEGYESDRNKGYRLIDAGVHSVFDSKPVVKAYQDEGLLSHEITVPEMCFYDELRKYLKKSFGDDFEETAKIYYQVPICAFIDDIEEFINNEDEPDKNRRIRETIDSINELQQEEIELNDSINEKLAENGHRTVLPHRQIFAMCEDESEENKGEFSYSNYLRTANYDFVVCDSNDEVKLIIEIQGAPHRVLDDFGKQEERKRELEILRLIDEEKNAKIIDEYVVKHNGLRDDLKKHISSRLIAKRRYCSLSDAGDFWSRNEDGEFYVKNFKEKITERSQKHLFYRGYTDDGISDKTEIIENEHAAFLEWKKAKRESGLSGSLDDSEACGCIIPKL